MSTLGFGDITFQSDAGRAFSMLVLVSGVVFLRNVLPFAFIQLFLYPLARGAPGRLHARRVPAKAAGHVILTHYDPIAIRSAWTTRACRAG